MNASSLIIKIIKRRIGRMSFFNMIHDNNTKNIHYVVI